MPGWYRPMCVIFADSFIAFGGGSSAQRAASNTFRSAPPGRFQAQEKGARLRRPLPSKLYRRRDLDGPEVIRILGSLGVLLEDAAAGDVHHDLDGAATDLEAAAVEHEAGDAGLVGEAEAAHELQGAGAAVGERRGAVALQHGGVVVHRDAVVHLPAGAVQEVAGVGELDLHLDDVLLHELEGLDALAELLTLVNPSAGVVHGGLGLAEQLRQKHAALPLEVLHELQEALALDAEQSGLVNHDVVEDDLGEGHDLHADLVQRLDGDALGVGGHQVHGHLLVLGERGPRPCTPR